jgi:predicted dehydrogenase
MNKKLKVAMIGLGRMGKFHLDVLLKMRNVKIVCALTKNNLNPEKYEILAKYKITNHYTSVYKMLINENIDAAFVQPSVQDVFKITKILLENNINCLIEKPPGLSLLESQILKKLINKNKLIHLIGMQRRFYSNISKIKLYEKKLGKMYSISMHAPENFDDIKKKKKFTSKVLKKWMYANGIHMLDLLNFFSKSEPKKIFSISKRINENTKNSFNAIIEYKNGVTANYISNWKSIGSWSIKLYYLNGIVIIKPIEETVVKFNNGKKIQIKKSNLDQKFKAGLYLQNKMFVNSCLNKNKKICYPAATIDNAISAIKLIEKLSI